jgi:hypothetical protein
VNRVPWWIKLLAVTVSVASILSGLSRKPVAAPVSSTVEVLDPFEDVAATVASLHRHHQRAECLLRAGIWEPQRQDAARFEPALLGSVTLGGRWLDIRARVPIAAIIDDRLTLCVSKGFDGVRFTALDAFRHATGFPLTAADQAAFNRGVTDLAVHRGLSVSEPDAPDWSGPTAGLDRP